MGAVTAAGILSGFPDGTCRPADTATRAQAVVMLSKAAGAMYTEAGSYSLPVVDGNATINTSGVTLKEGTIKGSLLLTEGIGEGSIVLEDITVNGRTVICGGGADSITLKNCNLGVIVIRKSEGPSGLSPPGIQILKRLSSRPKPGWRTGITPAGGLISILLRSTRCQSDHRRKGAG